MPGKRNRGTRGQQNWEMINRPLDTEELKEFDKWAKENLGDIEEMCAHVFLSGYKMSISYHEDSSSFISTLSGKDEDGCLNPRRSMSSWDSEMDSAIMMSLYKHVVIFDNGIWEAVEPVSRRG